MFVAKLPGSMYATPAMNAGPEERQDPEARGAAQHVARRAPRRRPPLTVAITVSLA